MSRRVEVLGDWADMVPDSWEGWVGLTGTVVARSGTTSTIRCLAGAAPLYVKRHRYPLGLALRASLRNTVLGPSRARREFENLKLLRLRAGEEAAPAPVAVGECRRFGILREAFLATAALKDALPLSESRPAGNRGPERLGRFLAGVHGAGFVHGSLFARNVVSDGARFAVVDLDKGRFSRDGRPLPLARRARDLAFLDTSLAAVPIRTRLQVLVAYLRRSGGGITITSREMLAAVERHREEAGRRLTRRDRVSREARTSPSSS